MLMSSSTLVLRFSAHDSRTSLLNSAKGFPVSAEIGISVISWISCLSDCLSPSRSCSLEKNSTDVGARSSWSVQPRVNHLLSRKASAHVFCEDLVSLFSLACRDVRQINVALGCTTIPPKH